MKGPKFVNVKRYGARGPQDPSLRTCVRCRSQKRRSRKVVLTATFISGSGFRYQWAYCAEDIPSEIERTTS